MAFDTPLFLFYFLPIALCLFFLCSRFSKNVPILLCSLFFYAWGEPSFILVVLASAILDWSAMRYLKPGTRLFKIGVWFCVLQNLSLLVAFKYSAFIVNSLRPWSGGLLDGVIVDVALPLGISFIVFEKITYVVDIGRQVASPAPSIIAYLSYIMLFPKLIAGPIVKYHEIAEQLSSRRILREDIVAGTMRACYGLARKVIIADNAGDVAAAIYARDISTLGFCDVWMAAVAYSVQIYFDFSAYSDMAIGLARIMGFRLRENFNSPYAALNFTDFWRRWHISLSTWIREYIYIPLGGSRHGTFRTYLNLWISFLLSGAWHGASWNYILWGAFHGFFLALDKAIWIDVSRRLPQTLQRAITFILVTFGWVIFHVEDLDKALRYWSIMVTPSTSSLFPYVKNEPLFFTLLGLVLILVPWTRNATRDATKNADDHFEAREVSPKWRPIQLTGALVLLLFSVGKIAASSHNVFLYFRF